MHDVSSLVRGKERAILPQKGEEAWAGPCQLHPDVGAGAPAGYLKGPGLAICKWPPLGVWSLHP